jgi:glycosyltransferase 2 family protein
MSKKRILAYAVVTAILAALIYMQFRTWKDFDWPTFWSQWKHISPRHILQAIALIYVSYFLRALRWKIFLRPVRKEAATIALIPPTLIGFTGLALLGRPGELIRPYLIARRTNLTFSSQMAAWAVERVFDIGAFTVLLVLAIFLPGTALHLLPQDIYHGVEIFGLLFLALAAGVSLGAVLVAKSGEAASVWVERRFSHVAANLGHRIALRFREFHGGLDTIHDPLAFFEIAGVSLVMWCCIALAYLEVTHAYGTVLQQMTISGILPLMGSSMVGSLIQLPGIGGGSQLGTISALQHIFGVPHELAASCGILLWLATFVSVVPAGLLLAHRERLSLRKLSQESEQEEARAELSPSPPA